MAKSKKNKVFVAMQVTYDREDIEDSDVKIIGCTTLRKLQTRH